PETNFGFRIADFGFTTLRIYDISGRLVKTLLEQELAPGEYRFTWDGRNESGRVLASGVYLYRLRAGDFVQTRKLILLR
ncbi:MAG: T9SS type A sorting domain-containing protein, partial [Calditrichaeota bacterium]|nr:T9SS type A sorting domain-containing protein [Calditrichota bacterium]